MKTPEGFGEPVLQSAEDSPATVGSLEGVLALMILLQGDLREIRREHEALKRICYLLVNNVEDEELRDEMHSTYMLLAMTTEHEVKEGFEDMPG